MPELPEVETLARDLRATVLGRTITEAWVSPDAPRLVQEMPVDLFCAALRGQRIKQVSRRGKYLLVGLDPSAGSGQAPSTGSGQASGLWWVLHRRMSGNILHRPAGAPDEPYLRARFTLDDGNELRFIDLRKFGTMWVTEDPQPILAGLGPEPLEPGFTAAVLAASLAKRSAPVKSVLLDQAVIAGMGNLYADEALHYASIHPRRLASSITADEVSTLRDGIVSALNQGLANLGSSVGHAAGEQISLRDHVNLDGNAGSNQEYLVAYGREGHPCRTCGTAIERLKLSNRSAHFCPQCQPEKRVRKPRQRRVRPKSENPRRKSIKRQTS